MVSLRRVATTAALVLGAAALVVAPAASANAHDYLVKSNPAKGATVDTALSKVVLTFDDRVLDLSGDGSSNVVEVTGPGGNQFETACPVISDTDVSVPVALGRSGAYTVTWQVVSADGHTVSDSIDFTYDKPAAARVAEGAHVRPTCGDQPVGGSSTATPGTSSVPPVSTDAGSSSGDSAGGGGLGIALGVGGGIIAVAVIAVVVVMRRNGAPNAGPPTE